VDGKANREISVFLAGILGIAKSAIRLERGQSGRMKTVSIPLPPAVILEKMG